MPRSIAAVLVLSFLISTPASGQDDTALLAPPFDLSSIDMQAGMQRFQTSMQPTEQHEMLNIFQGEWETTTRIWSMGPGSEPAESQGTAVNTFELGGRFLRSEAEGTMMGMPTTGVILIGFDVFANEYQMVSMSTMSTSMHTAAGHADKDGHSIVFYGQMDEMLLGVHDRTVRYVFTANDPDTITLEVHDLHIGVQNNKVVETVFRRKS